MNAKKQKYEQLNDFEDACMWMSYRYCIGRHTIASHMHAQDIANHYFDRLYNAEQQRMAFIATDINREIESVLRFNNFYIDVSRYDELYQNGVVEYGAFDLLLKFLNDRNLTIRDLSKYKSIRVAKFDEHNEPVYSIVLCDENEKSRNDVFITDLLIWQSLANLFNINQHKTITTKFDDEVKDIIAFRNWIEMTPQRYTRVYVPVESKRLENMRIAEEYIIDIK